MKTCHKLKGNALLLLLLFYSLSYGQGTDPVVITLTVDTEQLGNDRNMPGGCTLTAVPSSVVISTDSNPKSFTIQVKDGTEIEWVGVTTKGEDVKIKNIKWIRGINIFNKTNIPGQNSGGKEKVKDKIKRKTATDMDYEYLIEFKVQREGKYTLDPKIKVN
ncbi:hypothetical protein [Muriicola sp.]|uniref:hypothetical protein n=1 Tax=Muriicola sp. TaxID=2020856 RepID=UPI003C743678